MTNIRKIVSVMFTTVVLCSVFVGCTNSDNKVETSIVESSEITSTNEPVEQENEADFIDTLTSEELIYLTTLLGEIEDAQTEAASSLKAICNIYLITEDFDNLDSVVDMFVMFLDANDETNMLYQDIFGSEIPDTTFIRLYGTCPVLDTVEDCVEYLEFVIGYCEIFTND